MVLSPFVLCRTMDGISGCSHLSVETLAQSSFYLHETLGQVAPVPAEVQRESTSLGPG